MKSPRENTGSAETHPDDHDHDETGTESRAARDMRQIGMALLSIANLAVVAWVLIANIEWPEPAFRRWAIVDAVMVAVLLADFFWRLRKAWRKGGLAAFLNRNWYDLLGLVPLYVEAIPDLHAAGALRFLRVFRILRLLRVLPTMRRFYESVGFLQRIVRESQVVRLLSIVAVLLLLCSVGFWIAEPRAKMKDFDDALWCAIGSFTTAAYMEPQTGAGRVLATILMLVGMATGTAVATALVTTTMRLRDEERSVDSLQALETLRDEKVLTAEQYSHARRKLLQEVLENLHREGILTEEQLENAIKRC